jgi:predicted acylesterase/phospholipase RssA
MFLGTKFQNGQLKRRLEDSSNYAEWLQSAQELDSLAGNVKWKDDPVSEEYDYELIQLRLEQFRVARERMDLDAISFLLRASMSRGFGDIGNMSLYGHSHCGTKKLIEDYIAEVVACLELMYHELPGESRLDLRAKYEFFRGLRHMLGNTALLLSGGASLGTHHLGVLKALTEANLLPRIVSGSSSGSIMAAMLCTRNSNQIEDLLSLQGVNLNFMESSKNASSFLFKLKRLFSQGALFDQATLQSCMRENLGDLTFLEAYKRTRRILNIAVSSSTQHEMPRMLNYLTSPNVLIWSAVVASCAVPGVFASSGLIVKDPASGALIPWQFGVDEQVRWIDGSVENDVPRQKLSELFNVNHFIVSQVNPHVYPFLDRKPRVKHIGPLSKIFKSVLFLVHSEVCFRLQQLISLGFFYPRQLHHLLAVLQQKYDGDITIVPELELSDLSGLFTDPSLEQIQRSIKKGERATWPLISVVWNQCKVELLLDQVLLQMKKGEVVVSELPMMKRSTSPLFRVQSTDQLE